jgi:sugar phosphate isomerase/epimerase
MKLACQEGLVSGKDLNEKLDNLGQYGFEGIEFGGKDIEGREKEIYKACENHTVKPSSICAGYRGCPLDIDKEQRIRAVSDIKRRLEIAGEIQAKGVIMVPIFGPPRLEPTEEKTAVELEEELCVDILSELGEYAAQVKACLFVEPLNRYETHFINRLEQGAAICKKTGNPNVVIMADFFHMNIEEADISVSIQEAGELVQHIHIADSSRHQPGTGHTDFKSGFEALKKIGYAGYMAYECGIKGDPHTELPKSVEYLKQWL